MHHQKIMKIFVFLALCALAIVTKQAAAESGVTVVKAGQFLDVETGKVHSNQLIVIEGSRVKTIVPLPPDHADGTLPDGIFVDPPKDVQWIDLADSFVLPGLIDCHTHLTLNEKDLEPVVVLQQRAAHIAFKSIEHARKTINAGFTTVRDLGSYRAFVDLDLRDATERGDVLGPRIFGTGAYLTISGGGGSITGLAPDIILPRELSFGVVNSPDEIRKRVREIVAQGADWIKVIASGAILSHGNHHTSLEFSEEEIRVAVDEAKQHGLRVAAHAHATEAIKNAIRAGVTSIEHGSLLDDEAIELMRQHGTYLVSDIYNDEFLSAENSKNFFGADMLAKEKDVGQLQRDSFARAVRGKVKVAYGTDAGVYPHGDNGKQFAFMVKYGLTPLQSIRSATIWAAELLGKSDMLGSIAPGKAADLIAVPLNPLDHIETLEKVRFVMKDGKIMSKIGRASR